MSDETIDLNEFLERVQDDKALLVELLDIFSDDYKEKRKSLEQALTASNFEDVRGIAHSLKGASGNISAKNLRNIFLKLEEMGKSKDMAGYQKQLSDMDTQFAVLEQRIDQIKKDFTS